MKIRRNEIIKYVMLFAVMSFLYYVGKSGEPLSLSVCYGALFCSLNEFIVIALFALSGIVGGNVLIFLTYLASSAVWLIIMSIYKMAKRKIGWESVICLVVSLLPFMFLSPFEEYETLPFLEGAYLQKAIVCAVILLFACISKVALPAIFSRILHARLSPYESFCIFVFAFSTLYGLYSLVGDVAYFSITVFVVLAYSAYKRDSSVLVLSVAMCAPRLAADGNIYALVECVALGVCALVGCKFGKWLTSLLTLALLALMLAETGISGASTIEVVAIALSNVLPVLLFLIIPQRAYDYVKRTLLYYDDKHLTRLAIDRNREMTADKLFEISGVFRKIENTFNEVDSDGANTVNSSLFIEKKMHETLCSRCGNFSSCKGSEVQNGLKKLINVGVNKGRINIIDLPVSLTSVCPYSSELITRLNRILVEYKNNMIELENISMARRIMSSQARGVSEMLKSIAVEELQPLADYSPIEEELARSWQRRGIIVSEVLLFGDETTVFAVLFGEFSVKTALDAIKEVLGKDYMLSEKVALSQDKGSYIFKSVPPLDAAFGVSAVVKQGEKVSGDTHSVIRIDEGKFMMTLSDGMGSGEYARRISECTISLLESFYKARMPSDTILDTVNKLLTFNREESFACIDIAGVDLRTGDVDIVKVGSPLGFILTGEQIKVLESNSLPIGILDSVKPTTSKTHLDDGDMLVFLSDGITDAFGSTSELFDFFSNISALNPQKLADDVIAKALSFYGGRAKDDMTVLCCRIFSRAYIL